MGKLRVLDGNSNPQDLVIVDNADGSKTYVQVIGDPSNGGLASVIAGALSVTFESTRSTFRFCGLGFVPVANPTDFLVIQGSTSNIVRIKKAKFSGVCGSRGNMPIQLVKRTSAGTLLPGVLTPVSAAKHDSLDAAPSCAVSTVGTANYAVLGISAGIVGADRLGLCTNATGIPSPLVWDFARNQDKAIALHGTTEFLCFNANGADVPAGAQIDFEIEIEESSN